MTFEVHSLLASRARAATNGTKRFPCWTKPPNLRYIYIYIYNAFALHFCIELNRLFVYGCARLTLPSQWLAKSFVTDGAKIVFCNLWKSGSTPQIGSRRLDLCSNSDICTYGKKIHRIGPQTLFWGGVISPFNFPPQMAHLSQISDLTKNDFPCFCIKLRTIQI